MKNANTVIPVAIALLMAGCISVLPDNKHAVPRYDVAIPDAPGNAGIQHAARPEAAPPGSAGILPAASSIFVIGRVRSSDEATGRVIRAIDLETGRIGILRDGELARTPEAIVGAFLRNRLAACHPGAIVCDSSIAPRQGAKTTTDAWIERFRLEKKDGVWSFVAHIRFLIESPDGAVKVVDATPSIPIPTADGTRPTAAEAVRAMAQALSSIEL